MSRSTAISMVPPATRPSTESPHATLGKNVGARAEVDGSDTWCCFCALGARGDLSACRVGDLWDHRGSGLAVLDRATSGAGFVARGRELVRQARNGWAAGQCLEGVADAAFRGHRGTEP